jgi:glycosyltransferase involved in cell wall biosynthesis
VIIHGLRTFCGSIACLCCLLLGKPYTVFPHGTIVPRWRSLLKKYAYDAVLGKRLLRRAEKIACLSAAEREEAIQATGRDPRDVLVIDAGQLEERPGVLHQPPGWDVARILFLGRLVPEKSIELVIDAIAEQGLRAKYEIWLAGPEESKHYAACLRERADRLDVTIHFTGGVYGADRDDLIMESHLLVLVSEYESYGRVVMEALQLGTPVLVSNTCGIARELDRRCGSVVNRSVREIGEALVNLCAQDFRELRALRNSCRKDSRDGEPGGVAEVVDLILRGPRKEVPSQPVSN